MLGVAIGAALVVIVVVAVLMLFRAIWNVPSDYIRYSEVQLDLPQEDGTRWVNGWTDRWNPRGEYLGIGWYGKEGLDEFNHRHVVRCQHDEWIEEPDDGKVPY